jgi:hypothetical protein
METTWSLVRKMDSGALEISHVKVGNMLMTMKISRVQVGNILMTMEISDVQKGSMLTAMEVSAVQMVNIFITYFP